MGHSNSSPPRFLKVKSCEGSGKLGSKDLQSPHHCPELAIGPVFICNSHWHLKEYKSWTCHLGNTSPESCYLVFTKWCLERIQLLSEHKTPLSVKGLETTDVKHFHMLSMKNLDKWRFKVMKIINPLLFWTLMLITLPFGLPAFPLVLCRDWLILLDSRMSKLEPVSSGLKDKCSKWHMALILDYYLQQYIFIKERVHLQITRNLLYQFPYGFLFLIVFFYFFQLLPRELHNCPCTCRRFFW